MGVQPYLGHAFPTNGAAEACQPNGKWSSTGTCVRVPIWYRLKAATWSYVDPLHHPDFICLASNLWKTHISLREWPWMHKSHDSNVRSKSLSWHVNVVVLASSTSFALFSHCIWFSLQSIVEWKGRGFSPPTDFHCATWRCPVCRILQICAPCRAAREGYNQKLNAG